MERLKKNKLLVPQQHGFLQKHCYETQFVQPIDELPPNLNRRKQTDVVVPDFAKVRSVHYHTLALLPKLKAIVLTRCASGGSIIGYPTYANL